MADIAVDSSSVNTIARQMRVLAFATASIGYAVSMESDLTFGYFKTPNGGQSWGAHVPIDAAQQTVASDIWFDKWTPGDSGTKIHTCWMDAAANSVYYRALDTNGDSLGTRTTIFAGASWASGRGNFCSITKSRSGYLYCAYDIDAGAEKGLARSTDGGATWNSLSTTFMEATIDQCLLFPASNTGDDNDIWALYHDASADELTLKMWDSSAAGEVESAAIMTLVENTSDAVGQYGFSGSVRHSDGHLIVAGISARDTATSDHRVFDINGTGSITELAAITTDIDDHYYPSVCIDQLTNDIYVAYNGKRDGSQTLVGSTDIFYVKSTDDGSTWSAGDTAYSENASTVYQVWTPLMGSRFYAAWRESPSGTALMANYTNSVALAPDPVTRRPVVFVCT
jgi:hypothetical protein